MRGYELYSSPRSLTMAAAALADADGIKTAIATVVAPTTYSGAALTGVLASPGPAVLTPSRYATVTSTANPATYNIIAPIVVTGTRAGRTVTDSLMLTNAGGGETITGTQAFDTIVSVTVPAQNNGAGSFTFGVTDVACRAEYKSGILYEIPYRRIRIGAGAGAVHYGYVAGAQDTVTYPANTPDELMIYRVYADTTADPITLYW